MMNTTEMMRLIDSIARERGVEREVLMTDLEQAMITSLRKHYNSLDVEEFTCAFDRISGEMTLLRHNEPFEMDPGALGRIAAQTFKQVMIQKFREDERASIYEQFIKRVGDLVTGTVQRSEGGALVVTIDRAEAFMPRSEQIPGEQFYAGDRVRCLILDVRQAGSQVKIVLSRGHADFIRRLFEVEVPEVAERIIEIKAMSREPGHRTKLAVSSVDSKVDAVGACVGVRGSRIKNIVDELNGEKIDIVRWNESSQVLIQNALKPAEVAEVSLCFELGRATVVVNDDQLSLAIGKRGQNVRLAARLTGWDVDILTPDEFNKGLENMAEALRAVDGVEEDQLDRIAALGMISVFDIEEIGTPILIEEVGMSDAIAGACVEAASARAKVLTEEAEREKAEKEQREAEEADAAEKLLAGELDGADADTTAAAILGIGAASSTSAPNTDSSSSSESVDSNSEQSPEADDRAAAILSGDAEPVEAGSSTGDSPATDEQDTPGS